MVGLILNEGKKLSLAKNDSEEVPVASFLCSNKELALDEATFEDVKRHVKLFGVDAPLDAEGNTALHWVVSRKPKDFMDQSIEYKEWSQELIDQGANPVVNNSEGLNVIQYLNKNEGNFLWSVRKDLKTVEGLFVRAAINFDVNAKLDSSETTPLQWAINAGDFLLFKKLSDKGGVDLTGVEISSLGEKKCSELGTYTTYEGGYSISLTTEASDSRYLAPEGFVTEENSKGEWSKEDFGSGLSEILAQNKQKLSDAKKKAETTDTESEEYFSDAQSGDLNISFVDGEAFFDSKED